MKLSEAVKKLTAAGIENARGEARMLFEHFGKFRREELIGCDAESDSEELSEALSRREKREPIQHIIGRVDFWRESYKVCPDCLIPRQETELVVDYAVRNIPRGERFIDLCTGSGCIAISTLASTEGTSAVCADISEAALAIARENAESCGVQHRLTFVPCDVLDKRIEGEFFAVLSNPPYVTEKAYAELEPELYFEPRLALVGHGEGGTGFYERLTELYKDSIKPGGFIAYEIGYDQADALVDIAKRNGMSAEIIKDYSGNCRVAVLRK